jgi:hypothetical protein
VVVAAAVIEALASVDLAYPELDKAKLKEFDAVRHSLMVAK